ncbi:MAG: Sjogren's syndrome/scleroderma autoantigen 1 family protein [Halobacteriaceae archaeon]
MSDTDDAAGGFDKEAERERLREKYEADEEGRQATQRMSELLLQGATMTNSHCDECGNPIFRYEGTEFCSVCDDPNAEAARQEGQADAAQAGQSADDGAQQPAGRGQRDATRQRGGEQSADERGEQSGPDAATGIAGSQRDARSRAEERGQRQQARQTEPAGQPGQASRDGRQAPAGDAASVDEARAALSRKLAALAREAEATDDVSRSRELLAAASEAAEALAAVDQVR